MLKLKTNFKDVEKIKQNMINEIKFLRKLKQCENIIEIQEVYRKNETEELQMFLKFADHGCLRSYIINRGEKDPL